MWFDPSIEVPMLRSIPPEQRGDDAGSARFQYTMELTRNRRVGPLEGGDANGSDVGLEWPGEPPQAFLDSMWEGDHGEPDAGSED